MHVDYYCKHPVFCVFMATFHLIISIVFFAASHEFIGTVLITGYLIIFSCFFLTSKLTFLLSRKVNKMHIKVRKF